jgi:indolepyruvate decarboxylase
VISGAPGSREIGSGLLLHHQGRTIDTQARVYAEITCAQARLDDPARAPQELARVLRAALDQARPVYVEIPRDMVAMEVTPVAPLPPLRADAEAVGACADAVIERLAQARRPLLMVDVEVRRFGLEEKVAALARRLDVPIVTTFMGRGLLSGTQAPVIGTYLGLAGDPVLAELVEGSDGLLLLGVILSDTNFGVSAGRLDLRRTIQALDQRVTMGFHTYPNLPLPDLVDALLARTRPVGGDRPEVSPVVYPRGLVADGAAIAPQDIARAVNDLFDREGPMPIASDIGDCLFTAMEIAHTDLTAPGYYAGMGYGVPAGIGAQLATGRRALILVGDGAFQMTGMELGNCRRLGIDPVVIVFNNASWEILRAFQPESRFNDLDEWDFAGLAGVLGGVGRRVRTRAELAQAVTAAAASRGRFQLVEVMIPRGVLSPTLARFVAGQKRLTRGDDPG